MAETMRIARINQDKGTMLLLDADNNTKSIHIRNVLFKPQIGDCVKVFNLFGKKYAHPTKDPILSGKKASSPQTSSLGSLLGKSTILFATGFLLTSAYLHKPDNAVGHHSQPAQAIDSSEEVVEDTGRRITEEPQEDFEE